MVRAILVPRSEFVQYRALRRPALEFERHLAGRWLAVTDVCKFCHLSSRTGPLALPGCVGLDHLSRPRRQQGGLVRAGHGPRLPATPQLESWRFGSLARVSCRVRPAPRIRAT